MCENEVIHCYECEEELRERETIYCTRYGEYICENCRNAYYATCDDCGELVLDEGMITVNNGNWCVCEDCADNYYTCDHCGDLFHEYYIAINGPEITLCENCYNNYYLACEGCGDVYLIEDGICIDGYYYCASCAEYRNSCQDCILPYSTKPSPIFFGDGNAADGYYGVELEIDNGNYKEDAAEDIQDAGGDHIYLKEDGSLSGAGFEIVTHPATLDYHVNSFPWREICNTALSYGYRSHDTDTCGLHIHASRSLFGDTILEQDLTIAKIILLIDRWYDGHIVRFARRNLSKMRQWADKPNADIKPGDDDTDAVHKSKKTATDRYKAVNLCNYNTIEFRFFRGTLRRDTIIASIQWVDTIIQYCRNTQLKDLFSTEWDDIFGSTEHTELTNYLKQRNLYNVKEDN